MGHFFHKRVYYYYYLEKNPFGLATMYNRANCQPGWPKFRAYINYIIIMINVGIVKQTKNYELTNLCS